MTQKDARSRILDAAERQFAEKGIKGASLRAITRQAGVNLASVHYYFQSKESLISAVIARRIRPVNQRRLELLAALERRFAGKSIPLEDLLEALLRPVVDAAGEPGQACDLRLLMGRMFSDPDIRPRLMMKEEVEETLARFLPHLRRAVPGIRERELWWGLNFSFGCMAHALASGTLIEALSEGKCGSARPSVTWPLVKRFAAAGFRALAGSSRARRSQQT